MNTFPLNELEILRAVVAGSPNPIGLYAGREMRIMLANKAIAKAWGKGDDLVGKTFYEVLPELESQPFYKILDDVFTSGVPYHAKEDRVDLVIDGEMQTFYYNFTYQPLKNEEGKVWGVLNTATNVTEQVVARHQRANLQEGLRLAVESAGLGTWSIDAVSRKSTLSETTRHMFGFEEHDHPTLESSLMRIAPDYREEVINIINDAFEKGGRYDMEFPVIDERTGKQRWLHSIGKQYHDTEGRPTRFSGIVMDITDKKQEEIRKNDFIAMVSHELKTPLTSIKSYIQISLLKAQKNGEDFIANALGKADQQIVKMTKMIRGFLDLSKLETGKITLSPESFDLCELVNEVVNDARFVNQSHFIEAESCTPLPIVADKNKIAQVIDNLISNAVKYSPKETEIKVACNVYDGMAHVYVADQGIGIKPVDQSRLFDRFYRADNDIIKNVAGFGIGLYISAEIVHLHQGQIWVQSEELAGSVFHFSLPLPQDSVN